MERTHKGGTKRKHQTPNRRMPIITKEYTAQPMKSTINTNLHENEATTDVINTRLKSTTYVHHEILQKHTQPLTTHQQRSQLDDPGLFKIKRIPQHSHLGTMNIKSSTNQRIQHPTCGNQKTSNRSTSPPSSTVLSQNHEAPTTPKNQQIQRRSNAYGNWN